MTGTVVGYDPGGNGNHGLARALVQEGDIVCVTTETLQTAEEVVRSILGGERPVGLGIDTLTCWSTGHSGWRPADRWLQDQYRDVKEAVIAPGGLRGAMCLNGMAVLATVRQAFPDIFVTETHPKVLYYAQGERYDYNGPNASVMNERLSEFLGLDIDPQTEHEWDAAISILPVVRRLHGSWQDLHARPTDPGERLIHPCGKTTYMWPEVCEQGVGKPSLALTSGSQGDPSAALIRRTRQHRPVSVASAGPPEGRRICASQGRLHETALRLNQGDLKPHRPHLIHPCPAPLQASPFNPDDFARNR